MIKLEAISPGLIPRDKLLEAIHKGVRDTVVEGQRFIADYPPQSLTKTGYRRTNALKRSWSHSVKKDGNRIEGIVGSNSNMAPYNRWVQGNSEDQVPMFAAAGWRGIADLKEKMQTELSTRCQRQIRKALVKS